MFLRPLAAILSDFHLLGTLSLSCAFTLSLHWAKMTHFIIAIKNTSVESHFVLDSMLCAGLVLDSSRSLPSTVFHIEKSFKNFLYVKNFSPFSSLWLQFWNWEIITKEMSIWGEKRNKHMIMCQNRYRYSLDLKAVKEICE